MGGNWDLGKNWEIADSTGTGDWALGRNRRGVGLVPKHDIIGESLHVLPIVSQVATTLHEREEGERCIYK